MSNMVARLTTLVGEQRVWRWLATLVKPSQQMRLFVTVSLGVLKVMLNLLAFCDGNLALQSL